MAKSDEKYAVELSDAEWRQRLSPQAYEVMRRHGTERAGTSPLDKRYDPGSYECAGCGQKLFESDTKYDSRSGWPSFYAPIEGAVQTSTDYNIGYARTEVHCSQCGGHLGHVFPDGPKPTGERYCMNGVALNFKPKG
jgi:peptide-methionine (R)-S-oxide reductase